MNQPEIQYQLIAEPGSFLDQIFEYLELHDGDIKDKINQLLLDTYLPLTMPVDNPASLAQAQASISKLESRAEKFRNQFRINQIPVRVNNDREFLKYLPKNNGTIEDKIKELVLDFYLPEILPVEDPTSLLRVQASICKLEQYALDIRNRFSLNYTLKSASSNNSGIDKDGLFP